MILYIIKLGLYDRGSMALKQKTYAAIDLGTNNCRLSVAINDKDGCGEYKIIERYSSQIKLGEGLDASGYLSEQAINRAIEALLVCKQRFEKYHIYKARYVATEACRIAKNSAYFLNRVYKETSIKLEIVSKEEEAKLAVLACRDMIIKSEQPILLFDIGGGSSQLCFIKYPYQATIDYIMGLEIGVVNMVERFNHIKNSFERFNLIKSYVVNQIKHMMINQATRDFLYNISYDMIGTSGTATTLGALYLNLDYYDRKKTDGLWMKQSEVKKIIDTIISYDSSIIAKNPCIGQERADLVLAGCGILSAIMDLWPGQKLRAADRGLREGIILQLI